MDKRKFKINLYVNILLSMIVSGIAMIILLAGSLVGTYLVSSKLYYNFIYSFHNNIVIMYCYMAACMILFLICMFAVMNFRINRLMEKFFKVSA